MKNTIRKKVLINSLRVEGIEVKKVMHTRSITAGITRYSKSLFVFID